jgi:hypothetical protein
MSRRLTCAVVCAVAAWALNLLAATPAVATGVAPSAELYGSGKLAAPNPTSTAVTYNPSLSRRSARQ